MAYFGSDPVFSLIISSLSRIPCPCRNAFDGIPSLLDTIPGFLSAAYNLLPEVPTWVGVVDWVVVDIAIKVLTEWV